MERLPIEQTLEITERSRLHYGEHIRLAVLCRLWYPEKHTGGVPYGKMGWDSFF